MPASSITSTDRRGSARQRPAPQLLEQRGDARARDPGAVLELERRPPRQRRADDAVATRLPRLARGGERERLPGPGLPDHHGDAVAVEHEPPHHLGLLRRDRRPLLQRPLDRRSRARRRAARRASRRVLEDPPLALAAAPASSSAARSVRPARPPVGADDLAAARSPSASTTTRSDARNRSASRSISSIADVGSGRQPLAERLHHVAPRERRPLRRQPIRPAEPLSNRATSASPSLRGSRARPARELRRRIKPERRRPLPPLRHELLRRDAVVLRPPRRQRRDLRSAALVAPRRAISASISARRRLNARSTAGGTPSTSAIPFRTGPHSTPSSRVSSARSRGSYR